MMILLFPIKHLVTYIILKWGKLLFANALIQNSQIENAETDVILMVNTLKITFLGRVGKIYRGFIVMESIQIFMDNIKRN